MRATVAALPLLTGLFLGSAVAQQAANPILCAGCLGPEQCVERLQSCRSECRARIFSVDPRRETCLKGCLETEQKCTQSAGSGEPLVPSAQSNRSR